jgi:hypothetical protein
LKFESELKFSNIPVMVVIVKFFQSQNIAYKGSYVGEKLEPNRITNTEIITACT